MSSYPKPLPILDIDTRDFWESCRNHALALQQCFSCKAYRYPPRPLCPYCHSPEARWNPIRGKGEVYASLVMCRSYGSAWDSDVPYNISLISLVEGVRMWSNVIDCPPDDVKIGDRVEVTYDDLTNEITLPKFRKIMPDRDLKGD